MPSPTRSRPTRRSTRVTSRPGRTSRSTRIPLNQMVHMLRDLAPSGLSSREGGGNTVRNVTGDLWAGVAEDEIFDPTQVRRRLHPLLRPAPHDPADAAEDQDSSPVPTPTGR